MVPSRLGSWARYSVPWCPADWVVGHGIACPKTRRAASMLLTADRPAGRAVRRPQESSERAIKTYFPSVFVCGGGGGGGGGWVGGWVWVCVCAVFLWYFF